MKKVILLDDDIDICLLMDLTLKELGVVDFISVNSYEEFISLPVDKLNADLFILDINLGVASKTGIDVFDWLREKYPEAKVLFFTGHAHDFPELQKRLKLPGVRLIQKPMEMPNLENIIAEY